MTEWEILFSILQKLNPESDKFNIKENISDSEERWEDICYYMDLIKPEEEWWKTQWKNITQQKAIY